mmetsp:Transcript_155/g.521  ORF Transcript_155/g.521 Transcript_155/m.521 type:complete len:447 (-) Transcript_155:90-1430(-)
MALVASQLPTAAASNSPPMPSRPPGAIEEFLSVLEHHRLECEKAGKYGDAELAQQRMDQLKAMEMSRRKRELKSKHLAEKLGLEEAHMKELQEFHELWDQKVQEFEAHATHLQSQLAARHRAAHTEMLEKLSTDGGNVSVSSGKGAAGLRNPRWSKDLLNLRKVEQTLAKQKSYAEAEKVKAQADRLQQKEIQKWRTERESRIAFLEEQFLKKQELEMSGLLKRVASGREEQKQARKAELGRCTQRYQNVLSQLEAQHTREMMMLDKYSMRTSEGSTAGGPPSHPPGTPQPLMLHNTRTTPTSPTPPQALTSLSDPHQHRPPFAKPVSRLPLSGSKVTSISHRTSTNVPVSSARQRGNRPAGATKESAVLVLPPAAQEQSRIMSTSTLEGSVLSASAAGSVLKTVCETGMQHQHQQQQQHHQQQGVLAVLRKEAGSGTLGEGRASY